MQNNKLFSNYILNVKIKNEYKELSADEVIDFKKICQRWNEAKGLENEIQHQHNFLQDFFCKILGYTGETGNEENTLWWESGTNDGRRPDGILGFNLKGYKDKDITKGDNINDGDIRVVIELKGADVNLDRNQNRKGLTITPVEQGFLYAPKVGGKCEWVIISNFKEIRLYKSTEANKYHSFTISELASDDSKIKEFHFLLAKGRLFTKDKNKSFVHFLNSDDSGESIENIFYSYYYDLRLEAWEAIYQTNNTTHTYGKNFYLYKAQKLIDRIIFIRFCKEKGALDGDAVLEALNNKFIKGKYNRLKALFTAMNEGNTELGISKFNGGLFAEDKDLDCLVVDDEIIERLVDFYSHDFGSELDVNILGHIFEQSISDLETLTGDNQAKRKKDGVFYTPSFIVDYVMHLSIGSWLNNVRARLNLPLIPQPRLEETISDEEWQRLEELGLLPSKQEVLANRRLEEQELEALKNKVKEEDIEMINYPSFKNNDDAKSGSPRLPALAGKGGEAGEPYTKGQNQRQNQGQKWQVYADKLKSIKVLDPSCGSGAFLVKVFDYLQNEWKEVEKHIKTDYTYKDILKNNIYGVDLNPVSAGITKLSLWLKTAHYKEPLTSLDKNIKTGNTLIEDTDLAGYYEEYEGRIITQTLKSNQELFGDDGLNIKSEAEMQELIAKGLQKPLAFNWQKEFEPVFNPQSHANNQDNIHPSLLIKGYERAKPSSSHPFSPFSPFSDKEMDSKDLGFDVIVGNPPYGAELSKGVQVYLNDKFKIGTTDTAALFIKQAMLLTKKDGIVSFIVPKSYCYASGYRRLREELQNKTELVADCGLVWTEVLLEQVILKFNKASQTDSYISSFRRGRVFFFNTIVEHSELSKFGVVLNGISSSELKIANKMLESGLFLNDIATNQSGGDLQKYIKPSQEQGLKVIGGKEIDRNEVRAIKGYILENNIINNKCRLKKDSVIVQNIVAHILKPVPHIKITACIPQDLEYLITNTLNQITTKNGYSHYFLWALLNSKIVNWYAYKFIFCMSVRTMHFDNPVTSKLPVPSVSLEQQNEFEALAKNIMSLNQSLKKEALHMAEYIVTTFAKYHKPKSKKQALEEFEALKTDTDYNKSIPEINRVANHNNSLAKRLSKDTNEALGEEDIYKLKSKLSKWYEAGFNLASVFEVLQKFNIIVPSKEQFTFSLEFNDTFTIKAKECQSLQTQITNLDKEIDQMIYKLYGLTQEEIEVVEG